jgi:ribosomal protein L34E
MVDTGKRTMKRKSRKTPSKTTKNYYRDSKATKNCAVTGKMLAGTSKKAKSKESKTQKRPSGPFGGVLSAPAREQVFIELAKVKAGIKNIDDVDQTYRKFVKQILKRVE